MKAARTSGEDASPQTELATSSRLLADYELIRRVPLFSTLTPQQARRLAAGASKRECRKGVLILSPEAPPDALYVVLSGEVRLVKGELRQGRQIVLALLGSGEVFGEGALFTQPPAAADAAAQRFAAMGGQRVAAYAGSAVHLLRIDVEAVLHCLLDSASVSHALARHLFQRMSRAYQRIFDLAGSSAQARLLEALRDLARPESGRLVLRARLSARELGMTIGVTREYVSRLLKELESSGALLRDADGSLSIAPAGATPVTPPPRARAPSLE